MTHKSGLTLGHALKENSSLKTLILDGNALGDQGCKHLSSSIVSSKTLERLSLKRNKVGDSGALAFVSCMKARRTKFGDIVFPHVEFERNLLSDTGAIELANLCVEIRSIRSLNLSRNAITDSGAIGIADAIKAGCGLEEVLLACNQIANRGALALAEAMDVC